jgi:hypothetical protein
MNDTFERWYEQAKFNFVDEIPPLAPCGNCGKEIISKWRFDNQTLLLHMDNSMCCQIEQK